MELTLAACSFLNPVKNCCSTKLERAIQVALDTDLPLGVEGTNIVPWLRKVLVSSTTTKMVLFKVLCHPALALHRCHNHRRRSVGQRVFGCKHDCLTKIRVRAPDRLRTFTGIFTALSRCMQRWLLLASVASLKLNRYYTKCDHKKSRIIFSLVNINVLENRSIKT